MRLSLQPGYTAPGLKFKPQPNPTLQFGGIKAYVKHPDLMDQIDRANITFNIAEHPEKDQDLLVQAHSGDLHNYSNMVLIFDNIGENDADQLRSLREQAPYLRRNDYILQDWKAKHSPNEPAALVSIQERKPGKIGPYLFKGPLLKKLQDMVERAEVHMPELCGSKASLRPDVDYIA